MVAAEPECTTMSGEPGYILDDGLPCIPDADLCPGAVDPVDRDAYDVYFSQVPDLPVLDRNIDLSPLGCNPCNQQAGSFVTLRQWRACARQVPYSRFIHETIVARLRAELLYGRYSLLEAEGVDLLADFEAQLQAGSFGSDAQMYAGLNDVAFTSGDAHYRFSLLDIYANNSISVPFELQPQDNGTLTFELEMGLPVSLLPDIADAYNEIVGGEAANATQLASLLGGRVVSIGGADPVDALVGIAAENFEEMPDANRWALAARYKLATMFDMSRGRGLGRAMNGPLDLVVVVEPPSEPGTEVELVLPYIVQVGTTTQSAADWERLNINRNIEPLSQPSPPLNYADLEAKYSTPLATATYTERLDELSRATVQVDPLACDNCTPLGLLERDPVLYDAGMMMAKLVDRPPEPVTPKMPHMEDAMESAKRQSGPAEGSDIVAQGSGWSVSQNFDVVHVRLQGPFDNSFSVPQLLAALDQTALTGNRIVLDLSGNGGGFISSATAIGVPYAPIDEVPEIFFSVIFNINRALADYHIYNPAFFPRDRLLDDLTTEPSNGRGFIDTKDKNSTVGDLEQLSSSPGVGGVYASFIPESDRGLIGAYPKERIHVAVDGYTASAAATIAAVLADNGFGKPLFLGYSPEIEARLGRPQTPRSPGTAYVITRRPFLVGELAPSQLTSLSAPGAEATLLRTGETDPSDASHYVSEIEIDYTCYTPPGPRWNTDTTQGRAAVASFLADGQCGCEPGTCGCDDGCPSNQYLDQNGDCAQCVASCNGILTTQQRAEEIVDECGECAPPLSLFVDDIGDCPCPGLPNDECDEGVVAKRQAPPPLPAPELPPCELEDYDPLEGACASTEEDCLVCDFNDQCDDCTLKVLNEAALTCPRQMVDTRTGGFSVILDFPSIENTDLTLTPFNAFRDIMGSTDIFIQSGGTQTFRRFGFGVSNAYSEAELQAMAAETETIGGLKAVFLFMEHVKQTNTAFSNIVVEVYRNTLPSSVFDFFAPLFSMVLGPSIPTPGILSDTSLSAFLPGYFPPIPATTPLASGTISVDSIIEWRNTNGQLAEVLLPFSEPLNLTEALVGSPLGLTFTIRSEKIPEGPINTTEDIDMRFGLALDFEDTAFGGAGRMTEVANYAGAFGLPGLHFFASSTFRVAPRNPVSAFIFPYAQTDDEACLCPDPEAVDCNGVCYGGAVIDEESGECVLPVDCAGNLNGGLEINECGQCGGALDCLGCDGHLFTGLIEPGDLPWGVEPALPVTACGVFKVENWILPNTEPQDTCLSIAYGIDEDCSHTSPDLDPYTGAAFALYGINHPILETRGFYASVPLIDEFAKCKEIHGYTAVVLDAYTEDPDFEVEMCLHPPAQTLQQRRIIADATPYAGTCARLRVADAQAALAANGGAPTLQQVLLDDIAALRPQDTDIAFISLRYDPEEALAAKAVLKIADTGDEDVRPLYALLDQPASATQMRVDELCNIPGSLEECYPGVPLVNILLSYNPEAQQDCAVA